MEEEKEWIVLIQLLELYYWVEDYRREEICTGLWSALDLAEWKREFQGNYDVGSLFSSL